MKLDAIYKALVGVVPENLRKYIPIVLAILLLLLLIFPDLFGSWSGEIGNLVSTQISATETVTP